MRNERFWFGSSLACAMTTPLLLALAPPMAGGRVSVEGTVSIHGRPMAGGMIIFVAPEESGGRAVGAEIDERGYFEIWSEWSWPDPEYTRFRISLTPESRHDSGPSATSPGAAIGNRADGATSNAEEGPSIPPRFTNYLTSGLDVWLDRSPCRIDIALP